MNTTTRSFSLSLLLWLPIGCGNRLTAQTGAAPPAPADPWCRETVTVAQEPGRFKGWAANYGMWAWGDELLVVYVDAAYTLKDGDHSVDRTKPEYIEGARSADGGRTWSIEKHGLISPLTANYTRGIFEGGRPLTAPLELSGEDRLFMFAHIDDGAGQGSFFYHSVDRGHHWSGPYQFPFSGLDSVQARTDVEVLDRNTMLAYIDAAPAARPQRPTPERKWAIKSYRFKTTDGALTWQRLGEASRTVRDDGPLAIDHTIMTSTVRLSPTRLVSASRDWSAQDLSGAGARSRVELWRSEDDGVTWSFLSTIRDYDAPDPSNQNKVSSTPPALTRLPGGDLVVTYGHRLPPYGIRARVSGDGGATWGQEIVLRDDGYSFDLGYTRNAVRADGKLVTAYYFRRAGASPDEGQSMQATIWCPHR